MKVINPKTIIFGLVAFIGILIAINIYILTTSTRRQKSESNQTSAPLSQSKPVLKNPDITTSSDVSGYSIEITDQQKLAAAISKMDHTYQRQTGTQQVTIIDSLEIVLSDKLETSNTVKNSIGETVHTGGYTYLPDKNRLQIRLNYSPEELVRVDAEDQESVVFWVLTYLCTSADGYNGNAEACWKEARGMISQNDKNWLKLVHKKSSGFRLFKKAYAQSCGSASYTCCTAVTTCICSVGGGSCTPGGECGGGGSCNCDTSNPVQETNSCIGAYPSCALRAPTCSTGAWFPCGDLSCTVSSEPPPETGNCKVTSGTGGVGVWACNGDCGTSGECKKLDEFPWCQCRSTSGDRNYFVGRVMVDRNANGKFDDDLAGMVQSPANQCGSSFYTLDNIFFRYQGPGSKSTQVNTGCTGGAGGAPYYNTANLIYGTYTVSVLGYDDGQPIYPVSNTILVNDTPTTNHKITLGAGSPVDIKFLLTPPSPRCSISFSGGSTVLEGNSATVNLTGNANNPGSQNIDLWITKVDGTAINPVPAGSTENSANKDKDGQTLYYYNFPAGTCTSTNFQQCTKSTNINLPIGDYYVLCQELSISGLCSGNPFCTQSNGENPTATRELTCNGWSGELINSCDIPDNTSSPNDVELLQVVPPVTITPTPTENPMITNTPTNTITRTNYMNWTSCVCEVGLCVFTSSKVGGFQA